jgi:hypothetical protein
MGFSRRGGVLGRQKVHAHAVYITAYRLAR